MVTVEVLEFYPSLEVKKKSILIGNLRIRIPEMGISILGIRVLKGKSGYRYHFPSVKTTCIKTGLSVVYPFISIEKEDVKKQIFEQLIEKSPAVIEKGFLDFETNKKKKSKIKPIITNPVPKNEPNKVCSFDKEWVDLPPLKKKHSG